MKFYLVAVVVWLETASALVPAIQRKNFSALDDEALLRQLNELVPLPDSAKRRGAVTPLPTTPAAPTTHIPNLPSKATATPEGCGWRGFGVGYRTVGGMTTIFAEFKWTVAVINKANNSYTGVGSLIHPQVVLTVAHHFEADGDWRVRAGVWSLRDEQLYAQQERDVWDVVMHPKYDTNTLKYDVALLILAQPFTPGEHIGYLCLPPAQAVTPPGARCIVTGWGHEKFQGGSVQDIMKMIEIPVMEDRVCEQRLRPRVGLAFDLHLTMLCAGGERNKDACRKDGGAPLACPYTTAPNRFYQAGIVSWGSGCGAEGVPGVYANVTALRGWVDDQMVARGYGTETYTFH